MTLTNHSIYQTIIMCLFPDSDNAVLPITTTQNAFIRVSTVDNLTIQQANIQQQQFDFNTPRILSFKASICSSDTLPWLSLIPSQTQAIPQYIDPKMVRHFTLSKSNHKLCKPLIHLYSSHHNESQSHHHLVIRHRTALLQSILDKAVSNIHNYSQPLPLPEPTITTQTLIPPPFSDRRQRVH